LINHSILTAVVVMAILLAGCTSTASRMAECEAQGVSKDTCYLAEQNRQTAIYAAAEKQALENVAKQYAQSAKEQDTAGTHCRDGHRDGQIVGSTKG
jgi:uncharacterized protein YceK